MCHFKQIKALKVSLKWFFSLLCLVFCLEGVSGPGILPVLGGVVEPSPFEKYFLEPTKDKKIKDVQTWLLNRKDELPSFLVKNYNLNSKNVEWFLDVLSRYTAGDLPLETAREEAKKTLLSLMIQNENAVTEMLKMTDLEDQRFKMWLDFLDKYQGPQKIVSLLTTLLPSGRMHFVDLYEHTDETVIKNLKFLSQYISSKYFVRDAVLVKTGGSKPVKSLQLHQSYDPPSQKNKDFISSVLLSASQLKDMPGTLITKKSPLFKTMAFLEDYTGGKEAFFHLLRYSKKMKRGSVLSIPHREFRSHIQRMEKITAQVIKAERGSTFLGGLFRSSKQDVQALVAQALKGGMANYALVLEFEKIVILVNGDVIEEAWYPPSQSSKSPLLTWEEVDDNYLKLKTPEQKRQFLEANLLFISQKQVQKITSHIIEADKVCSMMF